MYKNKNMPVYFLISTFLIFLLTLSCFNPFLIQSVRATDEGIQQKVWTILNDVVGVELPKHSLISHEYSSDEYLGKLSQEKVRYQLQSNGSTIDIAFTFVESNLQRIQVLNNEDKSGVDTSGTSVYETISGFLDRYQNYTKNSFYDQLKSSINNIDETKNLTLVTGDTKLKVTTSTNSTTFRWTYTVNNIEAPDRCVVLRYKNGVLKYFIDNWNLYTIGNTKINISEQEAIDIAIERAKSFSLKNETANGNF